MKKQLILFLSCIAFSFFGTAQVNPHAIGIRGVSGNFGSGAEISYQHGLGSANRLEIDLGWRRHYVKGHGHYHGHSALSVIYHWVWNIDGGLNWFAGLGGQVGFYNYDDFDNDDDLTLGLGGQIGIEYDFNDLGAPIQLGLDARPMWGFLGGTSGIGYGGAFSLRYTF